MANDAREAVTISCPHLREGHCWDCYGAAIDRARAEGAAAEREACARWLAHRAKEIRDGDLLPISFDAELDDCAAAIRARRKQP